MKTQPSISGSIRLCAGTVLLASFAAGAFAADDPVLVSNGAIEIRRSDYEAELLRLPPDMRGVFATAPNRLFELIEKLFYNKLYAANAREAGLDQDPVFRRRLALETDRFYANAYTLWLEEVAAKEFDADLAKWEARAREIYTVDLAKYARPERVSVSHILFKTDKRSSEEARELARQAAAKAAEGEDFGELARRVSEDPSVKRNGGRMDYFARGGNLDPAFVSAAFALKNPGDVSEPVQSRFGWHVIKLEGRQAAGQRSFDDVKREIVGELRQKFVTDKRDVAMARVRATPGTQVHQEAIDALIVPVPAMPSRPRAK